MLPNYKQRIRTDICTKNVSNQNYLRRIKVTYKLSKNARPCSNLKKSNMWNESLCLTMPKNNIKSKPLSKTV